MLAIASGCGSEESLPPPGEPPGSTQPPAATPPPGYPREAASGSLADGSRWSLSETGLGQVCLRVSGRETGRACAELTSTWLVATHALGSVTIVFAGLPCGVAGVELRRGGERLDAAATIARDDVTYVALEGPASLEGVELVALAHTGAELFRIHRLGHDPSARVPTVGC